MAEFLTFPGSKGGFAIGLLWQHEETPPTMRALRSSAFALGRSFRWGVVHASPEGAIQSGFCEPLPGIKPGSLKSLAAVVASHHRAPWNGIFHLEGNRYWYVAVRQGQAIITGGDRIGTLSDLTVVRERHRMLGEWMEVDGTLQDLAAIVRTAKAVPALRDVQSGPWKAAAYGAAACVGLASIVGAAWYWYDKQQTAEREAQMARQRAVVAAQRASDAARQHTVPWPAQPAPEAFIESCRQEWRRQALAEAGWALGSWRCLQNKPGTLAIETTWRRDGGVALHAPGALSQDGNQATASREAATDSEQSRKDVLAVGDAQRVMWTYAQTFGIALQLSMPPALLPSDGSGPVDSWLAMAVEIPFDAPPWLGPGQGLDAVAGLRLNEISYDAVTQSWKGAAKLYALRDGASSAVAHLKVGSAN
ncbi:pilin accessory protein (PilO) [Cupriavidus gilardii J11]|uniref:Pilin accessory protein (PilO) n=1 Tax=Cupriavidus gilardii J11 TaxID=936133 RepID=A0A562BRR5_9BURK|nr:type 4b pilus protein PilO2 [Cupriavidus gilardii]TWG87968.1 pilin accessory protein (PilO) [Cupriavidus gilardii J11]